MNTHFRSFTGLMFSALLLLGNASAQASGNDSSTQIMNSHGENMSLEFKLYDPGTEIETYGDAAELVAKATQLQREPARRASLRRLGQRRALADHTLARSLVRIADRLGLPAR